MKQRILNFLIAIDQLAYVLVTLGAGHPDETLSVPPTERNAGKRLFRSSSMLRPSRRYVTCVPEGSMPEFMRLKSGSALTGKLA